jgi:small subunit ribosomal protein S23
VPDIESDRAIYPPVMGRLNLTAFNVRRTALAKFKSRQIPALPNWVDIVQDVPPAQILVRQQPVKHPLSKVRTRTLPNGKTQQYVQISEPKRSKSAKARHVFQPKQLRYEEDSLRKTFFSDHPWELARPRVILETSGDQHKNADWSTGLVQPGIPLSGECVVQRQLWLLQNVPDITIPQAYDIARKEFYTLRRREELRDRVAAEEARHMGAKFGKSQMEISMGIENAMYNDWEKWSRQVVFEQTSRVAAFEGTVAKEEEDVLKDNVLAEDSSRQRQGNGRPAMGSAVFAQQAHLDSRIQRRAGS